MQQRLERLRELARRTGGPAELEGLLDVFIGAFEDDAGGHAPSPGRLTDEQVRGLTEIGVDVEVVGELTDPGAELAAVETAVTSGALTAAQAAERLAVSPTRVRQRLTSDPPTLIGRRVAGGEWRLPAFQFDRGNALAEWGSEVIAALPAGLSLGHLQDLFTRPWSATGSPSSAIRSATPTTSAPCSSAPAPRRPSPSRPGIADLPSQPVRRGADQVRRAGATGSTVDVPRATLRVQRTFAELPSGFPCRHLSCSLPSASSPPRSSTPTTSRIYSTG